MALYVQPDKEGKIQDNYVPEIERFREQSELRTSTTFNEEFPLEMMRQYVSGMPWTVEYYGQYGDKGDLDLDPDVKQPVGNQSYIRISKLRIYVQQPLNQTNVNDISLEAIINAGFMPRKGDLFMATLIGGRIGMFVVEEATMNHYNLHQVYTVNFKLHSFLEDEPDLYNNIVSKVVRNYVYNKNYIQEYNGSILTREELAVKDDINSAIEELTDYYFRTFIDFETKFLKLPTKDGGDNYVDQELQRFVLKVFTTNEYPDLYNLQMIDYDMDKSVTYTIWDILEKRNPKMLSKVTSNIGFMHVPKSWSNLNSLNPNYMDVDYIVDLNGTSSISGIADTSKTPDLTLSRYKKVYEIKKSDSDNANDAMKQFKVVIPGLDFNIEPSKTKDGETITRPYDESYLKDKEIEDKIEQSKKEVLDLIKQKEAKDKAIQEALDQCNENNRVREENDEEAIIDKPDVTKIKEELIVDDINTIPNKDKERVNKPKPIDSTIQPIRATKQYNRIRKKE